MAKTYGELILEYQNYEYSNEHYELMKECYELDLMNKYIENQQFISENMGFIHSEFKEFDESYFGESVSEDNLQLLIESAKSKGKGIIDRIVKGLKSLWEKIKKFFSKLFSKFKKNNSKLDVIVDKLKSIPKPLIAVALLGAAAGVAHNTSIITKEGKALIDILEECWTEEYRNDGFIIADKQPFSKQVSTDLNITLIKTPKLKHLIDLLAAAYSNTVVVIKSTGDNDIMSIEDIVDIYKMLLSANSESDIKSIQKNINSLISTGHKKGISIQVSDSKLDEAISLFNDINGNMEDITTKLVNNNTNVASIINDIYVKLVKVIGNSMKVYSDLDGYRRNAISRIKGFDVSALVNETEKLENKENEEKLDDDNE